MTAFFKILGCKNYVKWITSRIAVKFSNSINTVKLANAVRKVHVNNIRLSNLEESQQPALPQFI